MVELYLKKVIKYLSTIFLQFEYLSFYGWRVLHHSGQNESFQSQDLREDPLMRLAWFQHRVACVNASIDQDKKVEDVLRRRYGMHKVYFLSDAEH